MSYEGRGRHAVKIIRPGLKPAAATLKTKASLHGSRFIPAPLPCPNRAYFWCWSSRLNSQLIWFSNTTDLSITKGSSYDVKSGLWGHQWLWVCLHDWFFSTAITVWDDVCCGLIEKKLKGAESIMELVWLYTDISKYTVHSQFWLKVQSGCYTNSFVLSSTPGHYCN